MKLRNLLVFVCALSFSMCTYAFDFFTSTVACATSKTKTIDYKEDPTTASYSLYLCLPAQTSPICAVINIDTEKQHAVAIRAECDNDGKVKHEDVYDFPFNQTLKSKDALRIKAEQIIKGQR